MYSLAIVDDEPAIRNGLATRIDWASLGYKVAATFEDGEDALEFLNSSSLDVILTDIRMAVVSGLDLAREVHNRYPSIEIVLLSGYREFEYAREAMRVGIRHYLLKPTVPGEVREVFSTIRAELDGRGPTAERTKSEPPTPANWRSEGTSSRIGFTDPASPEEVIDTAKRFIVTHFHEEISLDRMAHEFYFSPGYFSRLFSRIAGCGFQEYVNETRMVRAAELLRQRPVVSVERVAELVGLKDRRYFSRLFKARFGMTPSVYRMGLRRRASSDRQQGTADL